MTGIYIHLPFCKKKCSYCDFISTEELNLIPAYLDALYKEISLSAALYKHPVDTVYIGGGTPVLIDFSGINMLLKTLKRNFNIVDNAEITIEANPGILTNEKCERYLDLGINRLSLGLQASQDELLGILGRIHTAEEFDSAYNIARSAGFENINIDLIYGIPTQSDEQWLETLYHVLYLKPEHISCYSLKIEENTPLCDNIKSRRVPDKNEDDDANQYLAAVELLRQKGYIHYEISNFARFDKQCKHNLKYWQLDNYLGLGVAAHSNIDKLRFSNTSHINSYIRQMQNGALHYENSHFINDKERMSEYIMLYTRLKSGIDFNRFESTFGVNFKKKFADQIDKARYMGLCEVTEKTLEPTLKGFLYQNQLVNVLTEKV